MKPVTVTSPVMAFLLISSTTTPSAASTLSKQLQPHPVLWKHEHLQPASPSMMESAASAIRALPDELASGHGLNGHHSVANDTQETLQIIDDEQQFTSDLTARVRSWGLAEKGFNYDVVAVFGSQSTGKSTLLNRLFGVKFDVMNEADRKQTTKGIWMAKGADMDVLIMDVEGTDGRERGEDQDFERKAALFSMAAAEIIIVNMWEHQVGLYQGANMGLLKTVFEVNLALFQAAKGKKKAGSNDEKTHLLFVIRDHIGATPLANLQNTLVADLGRIWSGLSKPEGTEDSRITDYFDMTFTTLPHKLLQPENFEKEVVRLRERFIDPSDPNYVFKPAYHKRIPADGLAPYMEGIWEAVVTNKDLDLPTQQELLAQFRCDEIAGAAFVAFEAAVVVFRRPVDAGNVVEDLGPKMRRSRDEALTAFDTAASRYHQGVYERKRAELLAKANSSLSPLFIHQLKNLHKSLVRSFQAHLLEGLKGEGYDFAAVVEKTRLAAETTFTEEAKALILPETGWSYQDALIQLQEDLTAIADRCRVEETKKMVLTIERTLKKQMSEPIELALNKPSPTMWDQVLKSFSGALSKAEESYLRKAKSFNSTEEENETALVSIRKRAWLALRAKIDEQTTEGVMLVKLKLAFEEKFRYDADGVPRVWRPDDDIDSSFRSARDETLALIPLYARIEPSDPKLAVSLPSDLTPADPNEPEFDFDGSLTVFSETQQSLLASRFRREADAYYLEAKRSQVSSISQIPYWMYGVVAVLGWNEFVAVLRSPVYFMTLLVLLVSTYIVFQLNLQGPVIAIGRGVYNETVRVANDRLTEYFNDPSRLVPAASVPASAASTTPASGAPRAPSNVTSPLADDIELEVRKKTE